MVSITCMKRPGRPTIEILNSNMLLLSVDENLFAFKQNITNQPVLFWVQQYYNHTLSIT